MTIDEFAPWIQHAKPSYRQTLRDNVRLMKHFQLSPEEFANRGIDGVEVLCKNYVRERKRNGLKWPAGMAVPEQHSRATFHALASLVAEYPDQGLPAAIAPESNWLRPIPEHEQPATLKRELLCWTPRLIGQSAGEGTGKPVTAQTPERYRQILWQYTALVKSVGIDIDDDVELAWMTDAVTLGLVLPLLRKRYSAGTVPSFLTAIKRIIADLLGKEHPNVAGFAATMKSLTQSTSIPAEDIEGMRDVSGLDAVAQDAPTIWEIPEHIKQRSDEPKLKPTDADCRLACAVAAEICIMHLALTPAGLADINLDRDVTGHGHEKRLAIVCQDGSISEEPLTPLACKLIDELHDRRARWGLKSPWLFPRRNRTKRRQTGPALAQLATNVEAVLGRRLTAGGIQAVRFVHELDKGEVTLKQLSDAYGYKSVSSAETRFRVPIANPLSRKKNDDDK